MIENLPSKVLSTKKRDTYTIMPILQIHHLHHQSFSHTYRKIQILPPKPRLHLSNPPPNLHLPTIHILIHHLEPFREASILRLALAQHLPDQIATNTWIIRVAKVLVDALLERLDALAEFLAVVRVCEFLEDRAGVAGALGDGGWCGGGLGEDGFCGFEEFLLVIGVVRHVGSLLLRGGFGEEAYQEFSQGPPDHGVDVEVHVFGVFVLCFVFPVF